MTAKKQSKAWTLAASARAAREARIATARHLRTAPIARLWEASKLQNAHRLQLAHVGSPATATAMLFAGMGYKPPFPADWQAAAELVLADEARYLAEADLYILTPQMCDVVIAAAQTLTRADLELVSEDDPPAMTGLVVLPHPVLVRTIGGGLSDDRAYTWRFPAAIQYRSARGRRVLDR